MDQQVDEFQKSLEVSINKLSRDNERCTPADLGLILRVFDDILRNEEVSRGIETLDNATLILKCLDEVDELTWFDVYDSIIMMNARFESRSDDEKDVSSDLSDIFSKFSGDSETPREYEMKQSILSIAEVVSSNVLDKEDTEELRNSAGRTMDIRSGFLYGSVEMPNNLSRMELVDRLGDISEDMCQEDYGWMIRTLRNWVRMYAHAEAMMTNQNTTSEDLREFIINQDTPSERFW